MQRDRAEIIHIFDEEAGNEKLQESLLDAARLILVECEESPALSCDC